MEMYLAELFRRSRSSLNCEMILPAIETDVKLVLRIRRNSRELQQSEICCLFEHRAPLCTSEQHQSKTRVKLISGLLVKLKLTQSFAQK